MPEVLGFQLLPPEPRCRGVKLTLQELFWLTVSRDTRLAGGEPQMLERLRSLGLIDRRAYLTTRGYDRVYCATSRDPLAPGLTNRHLQVLTAAELHQHLSLRVVAFSDLVYAGDLAKLDLLRFERVRGVQVFFPTDQGSRRVRAALGGGR